MLDGAGWVYRAGDAEDAAAVVKELRSADPDAVSRQLEAGRRRADQFSWTANAEAVATVLDRLLA